MTRKALGQARQRIAAICAASGRKSSLYPSLRMSECKDLENNHFNMLHQLGRILVEYYIATRRPSTEYPPRMAGRLYQEFDGGERS